MISVDSLAPSFASAKKPKLVRTGSFTQTLRRSMSFVAMKTPVANMFRTRRNSVDPNSSYTSITSIESTFNESIKKPIQEKLKDMREKLTRSCKKDSTKTPKMKKKSMKSNLLEDTPKNVSECFEETDHTVFKTPIIPIHSDKRYPHSICVGAGESYDIHKSHSSSPNCSTSMKHTNKQSSRQNDNKIGTPSRLRRFNNIDVVDDISIITTKSTISENSICPVVTAAATADKFPVYICTFLKKNLLH